MPLEITGNKRWRRLIAILALFAVVLIVLKLVIFVSIKTAFPYVDYLFYFILVSLTIILICVNKRMTFRRVFAPPLNLIGSAMWLAIFMGLAFLASYLLVLNRSIFSEVMLRVGFSWKVLLIAPVAEELFFRGYLQGCISDTAKGKLTLLSLPISSANLITSVLFAIYHPLLCNPTAWDQSLTFFPSILFGMLRDKTGSIYPSILLHSFFNFLWVLVMA